MRKRRLGLTALTGCACALAVAGASDIQRATGSAAAAASTPVYLDPSYSFQERAADLVSRMTLAEKASQANSSVAPAIPRLGIQQYSWWNEALHGVARSGLQANANNANPLVLSNTTSYPIDQSISASWDPDLIYRVAGQIGDEARETAPHNTANLDFYSPTINLERDPRWGRTDESYSEDPYLETKEVEQFVNGMEGKDQTGKLLPDGAGFNKTLTTIKHFTGNNSEVNRLNGDSVMDPRTLLEYDTKPFRGIVQEAHPGSIMSSYNRVNGKPSAANAYLMDTLARQTFGFDGYFTSDCDAVFEIQNGHHWQPPSWTRPLNNLERNAYAMASGEDLDCNKGFADNYNYLDALPTDATQQIPTATGTFSVDDIDTSLVRLFTARMKLGEFDDPNSVPWVTQARSRVPAETWVSSNANNAVTETPARLALAREAADKSIVLLKNTKSLLPLHPPSSGPYKVAVMGQLANPGQNPYLGGYSSTQLAAGQANNVTGYNGIKSAIQAIDPDATVDFFKGFTGTGTTAASLTPATVDQTAVDAARNYDAVIVYVGTDTSTANEGADRSSLFVSTAGQAALAQKVAQQNANTIVYMETMGPIVVSDFEPTTSAILWSSYNGQKKGDALADVLLGKYNPSGRTPSVWFTADKQVASITDYSIRPNGSNPGRTYQYYNGSLGALQYPFGYGQSYSTFQYSGLTLDKHTASPDDTVNATFSVKNTGTAAGAEIAELYVNQPDASASAERPIKRLEGFRKIQLDAGQTTTVTIPVKVADLAFYDDPNSKWVVDPGRYGFQVSRSSADADIQLQDVVTVAGTLTPKPSVVTAKPVAAGDANRDVPQRALFPAGVTVDPQLTVSMTDDTLYGYVMKGKSTPLPPGMSVSYASNRPGVVAVDPSGAIRTVGEGVATVTATVTMNGVTKTGSFVVDVVAQLSGITLNGLPLTSFSPARAFSGDWYSYDVVVPDGAAVPVVAATSADPAATVAVAQAATVPGTATVTSTGADGTPYTYTLNFARAAKSDEFNDAALGSQWTVVRPDATKLSESGGHLTITPQQGDLSGATNTAKNLVLQPAPGDWTMESKVDLNVVPHVANQQGGIIAYQDDNDYLKFDVEFTSGTTAQILETTEDFSQTPNAPGNVPLPLALLPTDGGTGTTHPVTIAFGNNKSVWLKMTKRGQRYQTSYSMDGTSWTPFYEVGHSLKNVQAGLFAYNRNGTSTDLNVGFDYFRIADTATAAGDVGGSVPAQLALSLGNPAAFGSFTPGKVGDYTASTTADVVSTAGDATLSVADPSTNAPGHLVNGSFSLPSPLMVSATSPAGHGFAAAPIPAALLTYGGPVSHDPVTMTFGQHIGANDALRTGSYSKTLTFTLSTTNP